MAKLQGRIPHVLLTAHRELAAALDKGIRQYKQNLTFAYADQICLAVERFVDALHQQPGGSDELRRRALLVEAACGPGSEYEAARAAALEVHCVPSIQVAGLDLPIISQGETTTPLRFLSDISRKRQEILRALQDEELLAAPDAGVAYQRWQSACREVEREANLLEVDGCWWLFHVHAAGEREPTETAKAARAITHANIGGANLEAMKAAADSLATWTAEARIARFADMGATVESPVEGQAKLIAALTKHHNYADGVCPNLEPIGNNELARLAGVDQATASVFFKQQFKGHRNYKAACADAAHLTAALKLLSGEFASQLPYGSKPADEGECDEQAIRRLLALFTGGLVDERCKQAAIVLRDEALTTHEKLTKIDAAIPIPPTTSAEQLGKALGVSKQAVQKTEWWIEHRKGRREEVIGRRREVHQKRAKQNDPPRPPENVE